jgi:group I intron endonuclease
VQHRINKNACHGTAIPTGSRTENFTGDSSMSIYSIYRFTNKITGETYIGYTKNYSRRIKDHKISYNNPTHKGYNYKFYEAIREYGWESFDFDIIYQSKDAFHCEYIMEPFFIKEYNSFTNGYNKNTGKNDKLVDYAKSIYS